MNFEAYTAFLKARRGDFRRIAAATKGEFTAEDLHGEAWLIGDHLAGKRGEPIDWADPRDQDLIFSVIYFQKVKKERKRRTLERPLEIENDDGETFSWCSMIPASEELDPLERLVAKDDLSDIERLLAQSYSQAAAYVMVYYHFGNCRDKICAYLLVAVGTWYRLMRNAKAIFDVQPSLFDRISQIAEDFMPLPRRQYAALIESTCSAEQWKWDF